MASDTSWGSWWNTDGVYDLWNRVEASAEADWQALTSTAEAGYNSLSRGVADLFPSGGLAHFQISQYFHGSYSNAAFEAPQAFLLRVIDEIKASSWRGLESAANYIFGPTSVSLGIIYGLGESLAKDVWKLLGLAKMICLANLYAHLDSHSVLGSSDPLVWALANALDQLPGVHSEMKMAHDRMQELLRDLQEIVKHPKAFFQAVGKDISQEFQEDWKALTTYCEHPSLRYGFQLGKAVGRILYQLIMLLLIFEGAVKTATSIAAEFPRLARVARVVENGGRLADLEVPERMAAGGASAGDELAAAAQASDEEAKGLSRAKPELPAVTGMRSADVWKLPARQRGILIEDELAASDYKNWYHVGAERGGYFPLVDFQQGNTLVSLKSVDTTGTRWLGDMQEHVADLATRGATVNNQPANMVLDLRVQPGGLSDAQELVNYASQNYPNVTVIVTEYP